MKRVGGLACLLWVLGCTATQVTPKQTSIGPSTIEQECEQRVGDPRIIEVTPHVSVAVGFDLANVILVKTSEGPVIIDAAMSPQRAADIKPILLKDESRPVRALILTHSHIDHVGGASEWISHDTEVWASSTFPEHFLKQYGLMRPVEARGGALQFGRHVSEVDLPCSSIGKRIDFEAALATGARMPTKTFSDSIEISFGDTTLVLVEASGETQDQLFVWLPKERVLLSGDNFYSGFPNLYTIRGTGPRPVDQWIASLDRMRGLSPEYLVPSHTRPVSGANEVQRILTNYRDAVQWVHDQTVQRSNAGESVEHIANTLELPPHLRHEPYLQQVYGQIDWSVRGIYNSYLGWIHYTPEDVFPDAEEALAAKEIEALGGPARVLELVRQSEREQDFHWAMYLLSKLRAAPEKLGSLESDFRKLAGRIYYEFGLHQKNTNARGFLLETAYRMAHDVRPASAPKPPPELLSHVPVQQIFNIMATHLVTEDAFDVHETVEFRFSDESKPYFLTIRRGVLEVISGDPLPGTPTPIATVQTDSLTWKAIATKTKNPVLALAKGELRISGNRLSLLQFLRRFSRD